MWRWWNTLDHLTTPPCTISEQAERFSELFSDACRLRLRSDVPVGTCLSGGLDSTAVLCTLFALKSLGNGSRAEERQAANWQRAFVATFPNTPLDEQKYAELAIQYCGAEPHYYPISPGSIVNKLEKIVYDFEDIYLTMPIPMWLIYREQRRNGVVVSLDGHGSDEMLGGYDAYVKLALASSGGLLRHPIRSVDLMNTLRHLYGRLAASRPTWLQLVRNDPAVRFGVDCMRGVNRKARALFDRGRQWHSPPEPPLAWLAGNDPDSDGVERDCEEEARIDSMGPLNARLYRDFHCTILPTILRNYDRTSMAHGVEVRMPFMDWRLVCFIFSLPAESKVSHGFTKRVLREAMHGVMPESLRIRRTKIGFNSPMVEWFNGPLREWLAAQVNDPDFLQNDLWNGAAIRDYVAPKIMKRNWHFRECEQLWPFLHAHTWRKVFSKTRAGAMGSD